MRTDILSCDTEIFTKGTPLLAATTGPVGGNRLFEERVQLVAADSGQRVDWHYSGGIAQVLVLGDVAKAAESAKRLLSSLPIQCQILRWLAGEPGLYRANVTEAPPDAIAGSFDPSTGGTDYL